MALTKASYSMINGATVNVKDFGAIGDGIADDTTAIQAALDSGTRKVFLPQGGYAVTGLNIPTGCILEGETRLTTIKLTTTNGITLGTAGQQFYGGIQNIKVLITQDGTIGIDTSVATNNAVMRDIFVESFPVTNDGSGSTIGIKFSDDATANNGFWQNAYGLTIKDCDLGIFFDTNDVRVFGVNILSCNKGYKFNSAFVNLYGSNVEFLGGVGANVIDQTSTVMVNVHFFGCRAENMGAMTIPSLAVNCSVHDYRMIGTDLNNSSSTTMITTGNLFRDGITMANRVTGVADTTSTPSKLSVCYATSDASGLGANDGSFQFNRVLAADGNTADFGYLRYQGAPKTIGVLGLHRTATANPTGGITPRYSGEEILDTTNGVWYKSIGTNPADWRALT